MADEQKIKDIINTQKGLENAFIKLSKNKKFSLSKRNLDIIKKKIFLEFDKQSDAIQSISLNEETIESILTKLDDIKILSGKNNDNFITTANIIDNTISDILKEQDSKIIEEFQNIFDDNDNISEKNKEELIEALTDILPKKINDKVISKESLEKILTNANKKILKNPELLDNIPSLLSKLIENTEEYNSNNDSTKPNKHQQKVEKIQNKLLQFLDPKKSIFSNITSHIHDSLSEFGDNVSTKFKKLGKIQTYKNATITVARKIPGSALLEGAYKGYKNYKNLQSNNTNIEEYNRNNPVEEEQITTNENKHNIEQNSSSSSNVSAITEEQNSSSSSNVSAITEEQNSSSSSNVSAITEEQNSSSSVIDNQKNLSINAQQVQLLSPQVQMIAQQVQLLSKEQQNQSEEKLSSPVQSLQLNAKGGLIKVPKLAKGGVVNNPVAIAGEAGPEAVVPLNKFLGFITNVVEKAITSVNGKSSDDNSVKSNFASNEKEEEYQRGTVNTLSSIDETLIEIKGLFKNFKPNENNDSSGGGLLGGLGGILGGLLLGFGKKIGKILKSAAGFFIKPLGEGLKNIFSKGKELSKGAVDGAKNLGKAAIEKGKGALEGAKNLGKKVIEKGKGALEGAKNLGKNGIELIKDKSKPLVESAKNKIGALKEAIPNAGKFFAEKGKNVLNSAKETLGKATTFISAKTGLGTAGKDVAKTGIETVGKDVAKAGLETAGKDVAKVGAKEVAKTGGKTLGKSLLKKIPGVGLLAGAGFAVSRLMDGDFLGALGEAASGLASTIPGVGTAISTAIDAGLMAKDVMEETSDEEKQNQENVSNENNSSDIQEKDNEEVATDIANNFSLEDSSNDLYNSSSELSEASKSLEKTANILSGNNEKEADSNLPDKKETNDSGLINSALKAIPGVGLLASTAGSIKALSDSQPINNLPLSEPIKINDNDVSVEQNGNDSAILSLGNGEDIEIPALATDSNTSKLVTEPTIALVGEKGQEIIKPFSQNSLLNNQLNSNSVDKISENNDISLLPTDKPSDTNKSVLTNTSVSSSLNNNVLYGNAKSDDYEENSDMSSSDTAMSIKADEYYSDINDLSKSSENTSDSLNEINDILTGKNENSIFKDILEALGFSKSGLFGGGEGGGSIFGSIKDGAVNAWNKVTGFFWGGSNNEGGSSSSLISSSSGGSPSIAGSANSSTPSSSTPIFNSGNGYSYTNGKEVGFVSDQYETSGKGTAFVSTGKGDHGGVSYGANQLSSTQGSIQSFLKFVKTRNPELYNKLAPVAGDATNYNGQFANTWRQLAADKNSGLEEMDKAYKVDHYLQGGFRQLKKGMGMSDDFMKRVEDNPALKELVLSTSRQHGEGAGVKNIWTAAGIKENMSDDEIIRRVQAERGREGANGRLAHFQKSGDNMQNGLRKRFGINNKGSETNRLLEINNQFHNGQLSNATPITQEGLQNPQTAQSSGGNTNSQQSNISTPQQNGNIAQQGNVSNNTTGNALTETARNLAKNATGYSLGAKGQGGKYDCTGFVSAALQQSGVQLPKGLMRDLRNTNANGWGEVLEKYGFEKYAVNRNDTSNLQKGDILWNSGAEHGHVEMYSGDGNVVGAHSTKNGVSERNIKRGLDFKYAYRLPPQYRQEMQKIMEEQQGQQSNNSELQSSQSSQQQVSTSSTSTNGQVTPISTPVTGQVPVIGQSPQQKVSTSSTSTNGQVTPISTPVTGQVPVIGQSPQQQVPTPTVSPIPPMQQQSSPTMNIPISGTMQKMNNSGQEIYDNILSPSVTQNSTFDGSSGSSGGNQPSSNVNTGGNTVNNTTINNYGNGQGNNSPFIVRSQGASGRGNGTIR